MDIVKKLEDIVDILKNMSEDEYTIVKRWLQNVSNPLLTQEEREKLTKIIKIRCRNRENS